MLCIVPLQAIDCDLHDTHMWQVVSTLHEGFWMGVLQPLWSQGIPLGLNMQLPGTRGARFGDVVHEAGNFRSMPLWSPYYYLAYRQGQPEVVGLYDSTSDGHRNTTRVYAYRVHFLGTVLQEGPTLLVRGAA